MMQPILLPFPRQLTLSGNTIELPVHCPIVIPSSQDSLATQWFRPVLEADESILTG
jgi:hypothetical protein